MTPHGMGHPSGQPGPAVPAVSPPSSCCSPSLLLAGQHQELTGPWLWMSTALQQLNHWCVITNIFITNPKHSIIQASTKKINFILAKIMTLYMKNKLSYLRVLLILFFLVKYILKCEHFSGYSAWVATYGYANTVCCH